MQNQNPYTQILLEKGYTVAETRQARKPQRTFPCTIGWRYFETERDYQDALHEFLNGQ